MKIKKLVNGLTIIFIPIETLTISVGIFVGIGAAMENKKINGIAHFLEHMMFRGTKNRPSDKLLLEIEKMGCMYNASTSYEYTFYEMHGNYKDGYHILDIMIDLYLNPLFEQKDINIEKGVVMEELNMNQDNPSRIIMYDLCKLIFGDTSFGRSIGGDHENIINITRDDLIKFRSAYYVPNNTTICIAGKFKEEIMYNAIKDIFDNVKSKNITIDKPIELKQEIPEILIKYDDTIKQTLIVLGFRTIGLNDKRSYILDLIGILLSGGSMSRLTKLLRSKMGVSYFNRSNQQSNKNNGLFRIFMGIENDRVNEVIPAVLNELKILKNNLVQDEELQRIKKTFETGYLFKLETTADNMIHYGLNYLYNGDKMKTITEELDIYRNINAEDIMDVVKTFFVLERLNICIYGSVNKDKLIDELEL